MPFQNPTRNKKQNNKNKHFLDFFLFGMLSKFWLAQITLSDWNECFGYGLSFFLSNIFRTDEKTNLFWDATQVKKWYNTKTIEVYGQMVFS